jgi:hypothetical protein
VNLDEAMSAAAEKLSGEAPETTTTEPTERAPVETTTTTPAPDTTATTATQRARDDAGRFTPQPKAATPKATEKAAGTAPSGGVHGAASAAPPAAQGPAAGAVTPPVPAAEPASPPLKLPSSWKPTAREALAKAPREVQEEAVRIDREVRQVMQEAAPLKQRMVEIERTLAPFEGIARANGMDVMGYAGSVMQTAAQLFQGPPGNRPALIAQLIKAAGVNPEDVNPYLSGERAPAQQQPAFDPQAEVRRVLAEERQREQQESDRAALQDFLATEPEHLEHVLPQMTRLLRADRSQNGNMTPQEAYDEACWANKDVRSSLQAKEQQRMAAERARTQTTATAQARAAAVSIKDQRAAPISAKTKGLDAAMNAAREKLGM